MRKIQHFLLSLLLLSSIPVIAQKTPTANLTVFSEDGAKFFIVLNGERYNDVAQTNIRIEELPNPYYNCKIIFEDKRLPDLSKNALMLTDANGVMQDVTYRIKKDNKGRNVLRFFSFVPAQQNMTRPTNCATYRFGAPNKRIELSVQTDNRNNRRNENDYRNNNNRNTNTRSRGCNTAMNGSDFNDAKATIANNSFDETKLSTAKQIIASNCMSAAQITTLLSTFGFEETKLDFAKYAYEYCADKNNYFKLSNAFTFESSKTELNNYVQSMR